MRHAQKPVPFDTEDYIEAFYRAHGMLTPGDITLLAWNEVADIRVVYRSGSTYAKQFGDIHFVFVNKGLSLPDRRAVIAHEIGHVILHSGNQLFMTDELRDQQERQADRFAAEALVPGFMLVKLLDGLPDSRQAAVAELAEVFCVPEWMVEGKI